MELFGDEIDRLVEVDALTGEVIAERKHVAVYPASHYVTTKEKMKIAVERIEAELDEQLAKLKAEDRLLEAQRLEQRTRYDIEMMQEIGLLLRQSKTIPATCPNVKLGKRHIH